MNDRVGKEVEANAVLKAVFLEYQDELLDFWVKKQLQGNSRPRLSERELRDECRRFLRLLTNSIERDTQFDPEDPYWHPMRELLAEVSKSRAQYNFTPSETALFVFSLKEPLFARIRHIVDTHSTALLEAIWIASDLLDKLGLHTMELYQQSRDAIIDRQAHEMLELSTPVVELWDGILALPLIGTLDSARAQVVMETLLTKVVETRAPLAIIDITGVPTVDTLVAQHLLKTVAAARLMGADCIISGIRPQIAQTIVHLGVDLADVTTKATLADAFSTALKRLDVNVGRPPSTEG